MKKVLLSLVLLASLSCTKKDDVNDTLLSTALNQESDALDAPIKKIVETSYSNGAADGVRTTTFSYSEGKKLASMTSPTGNITTFTYEGDLLVKMSNTFKTTTYSYNVKGKLATIVSQKSDASTEKFEYQYLADGRLENVIKEATSNKTTQKSTYSYRYNANNTVGFSYTEGDTVIANGEFTLDARGNIIAFDGMGENIKSTFDDKINPELTPLGSQVLAMSFKMPFGFCSLNNETSYNSTQTITTSFTGPPSIITLKHTKEYVYNAKGRVSKVILKVDAKVSSVKEYTY